MQKEKNGYVTIEAAIGLTAFIFLIVAILSFINICRTQLVISLAVDSTAKEMSQYAYFYGLTGLQDVADNLAEHGEEGKSTTNELIGHTKNMFNSLGNIKNNVSETQKSFNNPPNDIDGAIEYVNNASKSLKDLGNSTRSEAENIKTQINAISNKFKNMDVEAYMKSMGALAANEAYHAVLSRLICPVMAKLLCKKHFEGYGDGDADTGLINLGISDGMDGLNFYMSEMFSEENPTQIKLVCYYAMEFSSLIDIPGDRKMVFKKEAVTNAWLNGFSKKSVDEGNDSAAPEGEGDAGGGGES